jgi:hypothetical protein
MDTPIRSQPERTLLESKHVCYFCYVVAQVPLNRKKNNNMDAVLEDNMYPLACYFNYSLSCEH